MNLNLNGTTYEKLYRMRAFALSRIISPSSLQELRKLRGEFIALELKRGALFLDRKIAHYEEALLSSKFGREMK